MARAAPFRVRRRYRRLLALVEPAAIAGMERGEAVLGASAIIPKGDVVDNGTLIRRPTLPGGPVQTFQPVGGDRVSSDPINRGVVPSGAVAIPLNDRVAVGLAVTSPYSFTTEYNATSWAVTARSRRSCARSISSPRSVSRCSTGCGSAVR